MTTRTVTRMLRLSVLALGLAFCLDLSAVQVITQFAEKGGGLSLPATARITTVRSGGSAGETVEARIGDGIDIATDSQPGEVLMLRAVAPGFCSGDVTVVAGPATASVILNLFPAAEVRAAVAVADGERMPATVVIGFRTSQRQGEVTCPITKGALACSLPAGVWDLRLKSRGYVPHYFWDKQIDAGRVTELRRLTFQRGAALTGYVEVPKHAKCSRVRVVTTPEKAGQLATDVSANARGFFQFDGIAPGDYLVTAECGQLVSERRHVRVIEQTEAALAKPLRLVKPEPVSIIVDPPLDPSGGRWTVSLEAEEGDTPALTRPVSEIGSTVFPAIISGRYVLRIQSGPSAWHEETLEVATQMPVTFLRIPVVPVAGRVRLGSEPLAAKLAFGGRYGAVSIPLQSDAEGQFSGFLPREGKWIVDVESDDRSVHATRLRADVVRRDGQERARIDLTILTTSISGKVTLDSEGVDAAIVTVYSAESTAQTTTNSSGEFHLVGLAPGTLNLRAEWRGQYMSDAASVELPEGGDARDVEIALSKASYLQGQVITSRGPAAGAQVYAFSTSDRHPEISPKECSADGRFRVRLPPGTREAGVVVAAPGFALRIIRVAVAARPSLVMLAQDGGQLHLQFPKPPTMAPLIFRSDVFLHFHVAWTWTEKNGGKVGPSSAILKNLEPGSYTVCMPTAKVPWDALWAGQRPESQCVSGFLAPHGELTLRVPVDS